MSWIHANLQTIEQVLVAVAVAFVIFIFIKFRDFVFGAVLGGLIALATRTSRTEQVRIAAEHERKAQIREDFRTLSDTMLEHSVRGGRADISYKHPAKLATIRQMVGRLEHECPELFGPLSMISRHFDQSPFIKPDEARQLLHPLNTQLRAVLGENTAQK